MERGDPKTTGISSVSAGLLWALGLFSELAKTEDAEWFVGDSKPCG